MTFYEQRLEGAKKNAEKLEKKIQRIEVGLTTGKNPYYYTDGDLRSSKRELEGVKSNILNYEEKVAQEKQELDTRVPIIEEFLERWKEKATRWYIANVEKYRELLESQKAEDKELRAKKAGMEWKEYRKLEGALYSRQENAKRGYSSLTREILKHSGGYDAERLEKALEAEKTTKRRMLVDRVRAITGDIADASGLYVGDNGEINGLVVGINGKATVTTISAGGYNIQCFHFRVLVKERA